MDHDVPPFRRATMDGFAVGKDDLHTGHPLTVTGAVHAGDWPTQALDAGRSVRVMTGAPVPDGTVAVVPFEWCQDEGERVVFERLPPEGTTFVVERGAHVARDDVVLPAGTPLDAGALGVLATAGCGRVGVRRVPRVGILGTGSELVGPEQVPGPGHIRNSNSFVLHGLIRRASATPVELGVARDEGAPLQAAIAKGLDAVDVLLLSGGVSKGDRDFVPGALASQGVQRVFHRWSVQPGGPLWCGHKGDTIVFGLPGNPAAVFVGFEVLVVPVLKALMGHPLRARTAWRARLEGPWGRAGPRRRYRPASLTTDEAGTLVARTHAWKGSGDPFAWAGVEVLAVLPEGATEPPATGCVDVIPLLRTRE